MLEIRGGKNVNNLILSFLALFFHLFISLFSFLVLKCGQGRHSIAGNTASNLQNPCWLRQALLQVRKV